jgi:membrane protein insertase Oxa1/YidC/SpoIIIJ
MVCTGILTVLLRASVDPAEMRNADDSIFRRPWAWLPKKYYTATGQKVFLARNVGLAFMVVLIVVLIAISEIRQYSS